MITHVKNSMLCPARKRRWPISVPVRHAREPPESTSRSAEVAREKQRTSTSPANALYLCVDLGVFGFYIDISGHRRSGRDGSIDPPAAHSSG